MTEKKKKSGLVKKLGTFVIFPLAMTAAGVAGGIFAARTGWAGPVSGALVAKSEARAASVKAAPIYYSFQAPFTSNLKDSGSFVQLALSVMTSDRAEVADLVKANEAALRSVVLMTVADEDASLLATTAGKQQLQVKLRNAMDRVLQAKTGQGGIDSVYFTSFVIQ